MTGNMTQDVVVNLGDGTYYLDEPLEFGARDGGSGIHKVIWRAKNPGKVFFSGGEQLGGWTLHDRGNNIWKTNVGNREFRQFYVNGRMATRARTPSVQENEYYGPYHEKSLKVDITTGTVRVPAVEVRNWARLQQIELVMMPHWYHHRIRIASIASDGRTATLTPMEPEKSNGLNKNERFYNFDGQTFYYFENAYEFLDAEGEWYLNTEQDVLYYKPYADQSMSSGNTVATIPGNAETLVNIRGTREQAVRNFTLQGIHFEYTTWTRPSDVGTTMTQCNQILSRLTETGIKAVPPGAVTIDQATAVHLERNTFSKLGGSGVRIVAGVDNTIIRGNTFYDLASNGVVLGVELRPNPVADDKISNNTVSNNYFTRVGRDYSNATAILAGYVDNCDFEHNEIHDLNYSGMQIGQQPKQGDDSFVGAENNRIRFNHVYDIGQLYDDAGGIYTLADQRGSTIFENYIHDHRRGPWAGTYLHAAIYLDNLSKGFTVSNNVLLDSDRKIVEQNGIRGDFNSFSNNDGSDQGVINRAGLQAAYSAISDQVPPEAIPTVNQADVTTNSLRIEVEDVQISVADLEARSFYSGGAGVKPTSSRGTPGESSVVFTGQSGQYTLAAGYLKENDGSAQHKLFVNGKLIDIWVASLSTTSIEGADRVNSGVTINNGDVLTFTGIIDQGAHGRMDYLQLYDRVTRVEAEDMTRQNATVETQHMYISGSGVKPLPPTGGVRFSAAEGGTYDVVVGYLEEDDGNALHELFVDDQLVHSWTADRSSKRRPAGNNPFEQTTELVKNITITAGAEVRVMSTINGGSHGRLDYVELLATGPATNSARLAPNSFQAPTEVATVYPNPAAMGDDIQLTVPLKAPSEVRIYLHDPLGRLVRSRQIALPGGTVHRVTLSENSARPLTAGVYTFIVETEEYTTEGQFIISR